MPTDPNRVKEIFLGATEQPDEAVRAAYLDLACGRDAGLRDRVEVLLRSHDATGSFLVNPAVKSPAPNGDTQDLGVDPGATPADGEKGADDLQFLSPSTRPDSLGKLGHYEMLQVLGRGGFGIVFRAFDDILQRVVAVKVMAPLIASLSPARKRFLREARSSAAVRHENVVQIYEIGEQPLPYLAMEFVPGETLQQRLDRCGPLDVPETLRIGRQIAEGLAAAHACDLIHRDIKPGNILLEGGSHKAKITDFGLARAADDASISQSGVVAGTPMFMAPEQALGHKIDQRADLFSLGSVLYQMASGRPPFRAPSALAVLKRVAEETPRPIPEIILETPDWLCGIIAKLHAKDPKDRFQSAREVADLLADCEAKLKAKQEMKNVLPTATVKPATQKGRKKLPRWALTAIEVIVFSLLALAVAEFFGVRIRFPDRQAAPDPNKPDLEPTFVAKKQAPPDADGWVQLFNGKDLTGWKMHPLNPGDWRVEDKAIVGRGNKNTFLFSEKSDYANFHLRVEAKINATGDSGIFFRAPFDVSVSDTPAKFGPSGGYEAQITVRSNFPVHTGSLMDTTTPILQHGPLMPHRPDEWFVLEVIAEGNHLQTWVNGKKTADYHDEKRRFARGHLALQSWGPGITYVQFRKIEIKELPAVDGPPVVAFEPRTLNLLAIIDAKQDTNVVNAEIEKDAAWSLGGGELTSPAVGQGVAEFPYIPPDEYDFRIDFTCLGGLPEVNQFLARRDRSFSCMLGAGAQGTKFGLQMIGGLNVAENTTGVDRPRMTLNERHACVVHVRNNQVSAELDGEEFVRWKTAYSDLGLDHPVVKHWTMAQRNRALLAVGTNGTKTIFHKAEVVEISGKGGFSRPDDPAILGDKWKIGGAAAREPLPPTFKNSIGMDFVIVPKGKSWLGGSKDKPGDQPRTIPRDFYLGKYLVTQEEWQTVMGKNPSHFSRKGEGKEAVKYLLDADLKRFPVEHVSWDDAQEFLAKLNEREKSAGWVYRLPNAWEWEYACRGGPMADKAESAFDFYFEKPTNQLLPEQANFEHGKGLKRPCPVGSYPPNRLGLFDMHGNVWEWSDEYEDHYRVVRGGCCFRDAGDCRAAFRYGIAPDRRLNDVGLRLARIPSGAASSEAKTPPPDTKPTVEVAPPAPTAHDKWLKAVALLPLGQQGPALAAKMKEQRPGFEDAFLKAIPAMAAERQTIMVDIWLKKRKPAFADLADAWLKAIPAMSAESQATLVDAWLKERKPAFAGLEDAWFKAIPSMSADAQAVLVVAWLKERNPTFEGTVTHKIEGGMVTSLEIPSPAATDLSPLRALSGLKTLTCRSTVGWDNKAESDAALLRSLRALQTINGKPAAQFWKDAEAKQADFKEWLQLVPTLTAPQQAAAVRAKLKERNPGSDSKVRLKIEAGAITEFGISLDQVTDISPIRVLGALRVLHCIGAQLRGSPLVKEQLVDLVPLRGLNLVHLTQLNLRSTNVGDADMAVFKDCNDLTDLRLDFTQVGDAGLVHFKGCKNLSSLNLASTQVGDAGLAHFKDCKNLTHLYLVGTKVSDTGLAHFKDCKNLTDLRLGGTQVGDAGLANFKGVPLKTLSIYDTGITDLTPLQGMPLEEIRLTPKNITRGLDILRDMKSLKTIGIGLASAQVWPAAEFWERYDKREFAK
jgi:serine/threonine protein kinase/formylglycine-generating enzyme required for sulfatase activity/Leucine-rich repeat (LRR) protein